MLLDELTNHLDIQAIRWLEDQLRETRAAYVIISHDRAFLRALTKVIALWIDFPGHGATQRTRISRRSRTGAKPSGPKRTSPATSDRKIKAEAKWRSRISARRAQHGVCPRAAGDGGKGRR